jgi:hypothetical protein
VRAGAIVTGSDVLGYHSYSAQATWLVAVSSSGLPVPGSARPDWSVSYAYERWQLVPWISAEATTSFFVSPGLTAPSNGTLRERQLEVGVQFPIVQTRQSQQLSASMIRAVDDYTLPDRTLSRNRDAFRAAWGLRTAHTYGYSVSPEQGVSVGGTVEAVRKALGSSADATSVTADLRAYVPMTLPHHVLAARLALGTSSGDATVARTFRLGGPGPNSSVVDFGRDAFSLLRGFPFHQSSGSHVALVNLDYRFPITRPQRGAGTWPVFLHTLHASVFGDAGETWTESFRFDSIKTSVGGELSTDVVAGYFFPFTVAAGAAWGHDNAASRSDRATFYVRIGRAF